MLNIQQGVSLKEYTTFKVGGPAKFFVVVESTQLLIEALQYARQNNLKIFILGGGSNVVVGDEGFDGLVILNQIKGIEIKANGMVKAYGGENWDNFVGIMVEGNLAGIECLSGIPGSVGGAVVQNIGAYGQTISDVIDAVEVISLENSEVKQWSKDECEFDYRNSLFKSSSKYFVLSVTFKLLPNGKPTVSYPDVQKKFTKAGAESLLEVRKSIIEIRADKGYVILPGYESYLSAGSFFKNPIVSNEKFIQIKEKFADETSKWFWPNENGTTKIAAAALLGRAGFDKGYVEGNVGISPKHSLAIINLGNGTAAEIVNLANDIQDKVKLKFGVDLEREVQIIS